MDTRRRSGQGLGLVGFAFVPLAVLLALAPTRAPIPLADPTLIDTARIRPGALRIAMADPPSTRIGGFVQRCNECHRLFKNTGPEVTVPRVQHTNVVLNHGLNDRCLNCHDRKDREKLLGPHGDPLSYDQVPELCARCHGTLYRDWQRGMHGKTLGSWQTGTEQQHRLRCTDCHDPHSPAYAQIEPLPGPSTLRMGDQSPAHPASRSPLEIRNPREVHPEPENCP